ECLRELRAVVGAGFPQVTEPPAKSLAAPIGADQEVEIVNHRHASPMAAPHPVPSWHGTARSSTAPPLATTIARACRDAHTLPCSTGVLSARQGSPLAAPQPSGAGRQGV